jgi:hypothetical protein
MLTHGVSCSTVFTSVWGVVDAVNNCTRLNIEFPDEIAQENIAKGFKAMSGASFDNVVGAIDGILIWILKPYKSECDRVKCGEVSFKCSRKDKYGLNMQAICDNHLRFTWLDINWPGSTADYMAWITSLLHHQIEEGLETGIRKIKPGYCILGDNAYVKTSYMSIPFRGKVDEVCDAYNFYQSQLRITIERAFGVLVHRWAILRGPLNIPLFKVVPFVFCLCKLHNYCINETLENQEFEKVLSGIMESDARHLHRVIRFNKRKEQNDMNIVTLNSNGIPESLLGGGDHFHGCPRRDNMNQKDEVTPMDVMLESVRKQDLARPMVREARK